MKSSFVRGWEESRAFMSDEEGAAFGIRWGIENLNEMGTHHQVLQNRIDQQHS